jgi:type II secretory ATPase GspE/PulE/Tfp pilus assembly ATPase PilB-like protein
LLKITPDLAQSISDGETVSQIEQHARQNGFLPLTENGKALIESGDAIREEVLRTLGGHWGGDLRP